MMEDEDVVNEMAPLYLFLASSLNVELVYIILTSISKFSNLSSDKLGKSFLRNSGLDTKLIETESDSTLIFSKIEVRDATRWSSCAATEDYI